MADRATENFMDYVSRTSDKEVLKVSWKVLHNSSLFVCVVDNAIQLLERSTVSV